MSPGDVLDAALRGECGPIRGNIPREFASALTGMVRQVRPKHCIEIGMAYGISTLAILEALEETSFLISIDPFQTEHYARFGRSLVEKTSRSSQHEVCEQPNYLALPRMLKDGKVFDFAYIDGNHSFDHVTLDAFYVDKMLRLGGVIGFNDCGFRSIHKYLSFFRKHRDYEELDPGLPADYRGHNPAVTVLRRLQGRSNQDRYFRKRSDYEPPHHSFRNF